MFTPEMLECLPQVMREYVKDNSHKIFLAAALQKNDPRNIEYLTNLVEYLAEDANTTMGNMADHMKEKFGLSLDETVVLVWFLYKEGIIVHPE